MIENRLNLASIGRMGRAAWHGGPGRTGTDLSMDRTIQYFQDRTEYGSYDPIFPGYEEVEKIRFPIFPEYEKVEKN